MTTDDIIDYAMPLIKIENYTKQVHDHALHGDLKAAHEVSMVLGAEVRILQRTLEIMVERQR
jgi:mRNA-degrading endonuclease YafQ of YafQ-DinJ toxin-antitoxin module